MEELYEKFKADTAKRMAMMRADEVQIKSSEQQMEKVEDEKKPNLEIDDTLVDYKLSDVEDEM